MNHYKKQNTPIKDADVTMVAQVGRLQNTESPAMISVVSGPQNLIGRIWELADQKILGRDKNKAGIFVADHSLSREHILFTYSDQGVQVKDLGSTNSTFLNNQILKSYHVYPLQTGDLLKCGDIIFKFVEPNSVEARSLLRLRDSIYTDHLCQINNRKYMEMCSQELISFCQSHSLNLSFIIFDIDYFKKINDRYGHIIGDEVLRQIPSLLQKHIRQSDIFCRIGGEEFAFLLECKKDFAIQFAEKIRNLIETHAFVINQHSLSVTISLGLTHLQIGDKEWTDLYQRADKALYSAKTNGRNQLYVA